MINCKKFLVKFYSGILAKVFSLVPNILCMWQQWRIKNCQTYSYTYYIATCQHPSQLLCCMECKENCVVAMQANCYLQFRWNNPSIWSPCEAHTSVRQLVTAQSMYYRNLVLDQAILKARCSRENKILVQPFSIKTAL